MIGTAQQLGCSLLLHGKDPRGKSQGLQRHRGLRGWLRKLLLGWCRNRRGKGRQEHRGGEKPKQKRTLGPKAHQLGQKNRCAFSFHPQKVKTGSPCAVREYREPPRNKTSVISCLGRLLRVPVWRQTNRRKLAAESRQPRRDEGEVPTYKALDNVHPGLSRHNSDPRHRIRSQQRGSK